ncbi:hypothetical protein H5410_010635 [Solanum commersonii]|uniref:Uncharacterized protein n=1 Tax=Solanum commersonii TaxID=4109 RepID=A0A9J6AM03_SOLCO|nr:hypothetical protein H5410_010635 [Solanum commersonii]
MTRGFSQIKLCQNPKRPFLVAGRNTRHLYPSGSGNIHRTHSSFSFSSGFHTESREDEVFLSSILYLLAMSPQTFKNRLVHWCVFYKGDRLLLFYKEITQANMDFLVSWLSTMQNRRSTLLLMENIPAVCLASSTALGCQHPSPSAIQAIKHTFLGAIPPVIQASADRCDPSRSHVLGCQHWTRVATQANKHILLGAQVYSKPTQHSHRSCIATLQCNRK